MGISVKMINLTYSNFSNMNDRLMNDPLRNHTKEELSRRINSAYSDELLFGKNVEKNADVRLYTDTISVQETFDIVSKKLILRK